MRFSISETAKWGDVSVGPKIIDASVKKRMKAALKNIQSGKFAREWVAEYKGGYKRYNACSSKVNSTRSKRPGPSSARSCLDGQEKHQGRASRLLRNLIKDRRWPMFDC